MKEKVIDQLRRAYDDGRVNAMNIFKGYHYATGASGWHWQDFGRNEVHFIGKSISEVKEYIDEVLQCRR